MKRREVRKQVHQRENRAVYNNELYVLLDGSKLKERKFHIGDFISLHLKDGHLIQGELTNIIDNELSITVSEKSARPFYIENVFISEIAAINKHEKYKGLKWKWSVLSLSPFFDDWIFHRIKPGEDPLTFVWVGVTEVTTLLVTNRTKLFNSIKIEEGKRGLRVLQY